MVMTDAAPRAAVAGMAALASLGRGYTTCLAPLDWSSLSAIPHSGQAVADHLGRLCWHHHTWNSTFPQKYDIAVIHCSLFFLTSYHIHLVALLPLSYFTVVFLASHVSASLCRRVL